jgi:hypothetical protein
MKRYSCFCSLEKGSIAETITVRASSDARACRLAAELLSKNEEYCSAEIYDGERRVCAVDENGCAGLCLEPDGRASGSRKRAVTSRT